MKKAVYYLGLLLVLNSCSKDEGPAFPFEHLDSSKTGITFSNQLIDTDSFNIMQYLYYYNGGGVAAGDINNDGWVDLFFTGNQVNDVLYLNQKNNSFKDISASSGINIHNGWSTGVTMLDINKDGWLDIYVCRLGNYKMYKDHNRLYINNQDGTFTESAADYGLDFSGFSTQAAFFDYDKDGDLDCYLLNHSVKRPDQFVQAERIRNESDSLAGDVLYENVGGRFENVTKASGIYSSNVGFGLSVCVADLNYDSWPDIYVGNDFHENDYLYLNNRDGTFKESIEQSIGHTSNFTMGSTIADINSDGGMDIFSLDMQPKSEIIYKQSGGWESKQIYDFKREYGYHHQSSRNALQLKKGLKNDIPVFSEQASIYDLHASDWSWTPLIKDFDLDGDKDVYITNGIFKRPNDMDFVNYFSDPQNGNKSDLEMIEKMPSGQIPNQYFSNEDQSFIEFSSSVPTISNGACTADIDNDGDLDIIINNINQESSILLNTSNPEMYLKIKIENDSIQMMAKSGLYIYCTDDGGDHFIPDFFSNNQGFMSMDEAIAVFPKSNQPVDIAILYPDGYISDHKIDTETKILTLDASALEGRGTEVTMSGYFEQDSLIRHIENVYNDQNKEPLLLYNSSQNGPKMTHDGDGLIFIPQGKNTNGSLFDINTNTVIQTISKGGATQFVDETDALFFDADGDGDNDLYVGLGGNELPDGNPLLSDILFINENGKYTSDLNRLPLISKNTSTVSSSDYDQDGDIDLFVGVQGRAGDYGNSSDSYLLINEGNQNFKSQNISVKGMVYDSAWKDLDGDGREDLIVVGHWMPITIMFNREKGFEKFEIPNSNGWWYSLKIDDFDKNGKLDIMAGNFGQNHRLNVDVDAPLKMYLNDFDQNGKIDPIISYQVEGVEFPYANLDLLLKQIPIKKKQFVLHSDYASKSIDEIFSESEIEASVIKKTHTLSSSVFFQNSSMDWETKDLPRSLQLAPIWAIESNGNDYFLGGNHFDIDPNLGRQDALPLSVVSFEGREIQYKENSTLKIHNEEIRSLLSIGSNLYIGINDGYVLEKRIGKKY